jgi:BON domain-containing protein
MNSGQLKRVTKRRMTAMRRGLILNEKTAARRGLALMVLAIAIAIPSLTVAQNGDAPSGSGAPIWNATPAGSVSTPASPKSSLPATISPTIVEGSSVPGPAKAPHNRKHRALRKPPSWVLQSKVQLALQSDPRFKSVRATVTQPGVIVLEGEVFDKDAKGAAEQTAVGVEGVKRVINALTTNSLQWLLVQNRINQALQQNGFPLVSVKVIGKTAFISGEVSSDAEKDKAVTVVNSTAPDVTIGTNLITVVSPGMF